METQQSSNDGIVEFSYLSQPAEEFSSVQLLHLAQQVWLHNICHGITGELRFENGRFAQIIEGDCAVVLPLVARILTDPRHTAINILSFCEIAERKHPQWRSIGMMPGDVGTEFRDHTAHAAPRKIRARAPLLQVSSDRPDNVLRLVSGG